MRIRVKRNRLQQVLLPAALVYPLLVLVLTVLYMVAPQRAGFLALTAIFEPYLYAPLLLLLPFALRYRNRSLGLALVACAILFSVRFGPTLISLPPLLPPASARSAAPEVTALTWNLRSGNHQLAEITEALTEAAVAIAALQELTVAESARIASSATLAQRYPYQVLEPRRAQQHSVRVQGMGLLSRYPILEYGVFKSPAAIWARLDLGHGQRLLVINATPARARINLPAYNPSQRDAQIRRLRALIDPILQRGEPLLVLGDFNVTQREPAYTELTAGLQDAHLQVGLGFGNTWRPQVLMDLPLALLRIDYLLSSPQVRPLSIDADCTPHRSDHCIVRGRFELRTR